MSNTSIHPSTIDGIKRLAKEVKTERGIKHTAALDEISRAVGYSNFKHARNCIQQSHPSFTIFITAYWLDKKTQLRGHETLQIQISEPISALIKPAHLFLNRGLSRFRLEAPDHLANKHLASSKIDAQGYAKTAALTMQFIDATKLVPCVSYTRALPKAANGKTIPAMDHSSIWYDRKTKRYLTADEPYEPAALSQSSERTAWAHKNQFSIAKPNWPGMYNPTGNSRLYLFSHKEKGIPLGPLVSNLNQLHANPIRDTWIDNSDGSVWFYSPGKLAHLGKENTVRTVPKLSTGTRNSVEYNQTFVGPQRRPAAKMPIEKHTDVGTLLKSVLAVTYKRKSVYNKLNSVRSTLDEWVQREYTSEEELSQEKFANLYYGGLEHSLAEKMDQHTRPTHIKNIARVKIILVENYPDCAPLRGILRMIDSATTSLQSWVFK